MTYEYSEIEIHGVAQGSNSEGDYEYRVAVEGDREQTNHEYDEIPQAGRQRINFHGMFTVGPETASPCYTAEADGYEFRIEYEESDEHITWEYPTPSSENSPASISVGLAPPLPGWLSAGMAYSVNLNGQTYDDEYASWAHWSVDTNEMPWDQESLAEVYVDLDHDGSQAGEHKNFWSWGSFSWNYWDNCPEYHTNIAFSESVKAYNAFDMKVVDV